MSLKRQELEIKLDILKSLARSQKALASMMEQIAEMTITAPPAQDRELMREWIAIRKHQRVLAEKILGIRLGHVVQGRPGALWISDMCKVKISRRSPL